MPLHTSTKGVSFDQHEVSVTDGLLMRRFKRFGDLQRDAERLNG